MLDMLLRHSSSPTIFAGGTQRFHRAFAASSVTTRSIEHQPFCLNVIFDIIAVRPDRRIPSSPTD
ncbi:MAG: hypothetical protein ACRECG_12215 [Bradyrhizobium sp.]|jgi:hypothetical protein